MPDADILQEALGRTVELSFQDGHRVLGHLLDAKTVDDEVLYKVLKVLNVGPARFVSVKVGTVAVAKLSELVSCRIVGDANET